ncbi:peptide/nickel transport system substrate-binding protein [Kitasatospora sp. MAP12-15]|uniref:ABC transporter family substrate-binding protein n=1 Tax=unclassified Kitasatospora TaxID=2633591 RepID=UPI002473B260|nr:ABC transporter family substrate-binding protein [Kitasatospora sp. MAP12-44]MDH6112622.1 peptide/nickel transport system substrate-binding protein [Kitasatospora sp. MAP12-44]
MTTSRFLRRALAAAVVLGALAGCSAPPPPPPRPVPLPAASDLTPGERSAVGDGGTLRWAVDAVPDSLDVYQPAATADTALIAHALLPSLFRPDDRGRPTADPDYLAGAEASDRTVTYRLNPRAVWSDGRPLTAADFTAQWTALRATHPGYAAISAIAPGADPHQVTVTFKQPYAPWRALFSPLYPAAGLPVTGGPLALRSLDAKGGKASLVRNPNWWGDAVKVDGIDFLATPNRLDALDQGAVDVAALQSTVDASDQALRRAEALPGLSLHRAPAPAFTQLTLNGARGPLAAPAVRRAVAAAIDRRTVAEAALAPLGLPVTPLGNHLLMADQDGYQDDSGALAPTARNLDLDLTLLIPAGSAIARRAADALVAQLAPAGITVHPQAVPADGFVRDHLVDGDWDLALFSWPATAFPAADARPLYAKPRPGADGRLMAGTNFGGSGTDEIDQLFDRAAAEPDPAAQTALLRQLDVRIWQLGHSVPLYQRPDLVAVRDGVAGAGAFGFAWPRYQDLGFLRRQ